MKKKSVFYFDKNSPLGKYLPIAIPIWVILLLYFIFSTYRWDKNYEEVLFKSAIKLNVEKAIETKSFLTLNDSVSILSACPVLSNGKFPNWLKENNPPLWRPKNVVFKPNLNDIPPPYKLFKKPYSDSIKVIKYRDTLYLKLL